MEWKRLYSPAEVADELGVATSTVWRWCREGKIEYQRLSKKCYKIRREEVLKEVWKRRRLDDSASQIDAAKERIEKLEQREQTLKDRIKEMSDDEQ